MARPHKVLRMLMHEYELTNKTLSDELGCAESTVSLKLNARYPWTSAEMWKIMEIFNQPAHRMHEIFPKDGQNEPGAKRAKRTA